ncbi:MAG: TnpV protein [Erysipelotrichaceae bacterium]|nr:TnpV protein [Erysipelotrichaceae bacterium]
MTKKIEYIKTGDYYYPNLKVDNVLGNKKPLGKYGRLRLAYLKHNERAHYNALLIENKLYDHLHEIDKQAWEMHDLLVEQYKEKWRVTEQLKQQDQIEWVRKMNLIEAIIQDELYLMIVEQ